MKKYFPYFLLSLISLVVGVVIGVSVFGLGFGAEAVDLRTEGPHMRALYDIDPYAYTPTPSPEAKEILIAQSLFASMTSSMLAIDSLTKDSTDPATQALAKQVSDTIMTSLKDAGNNFRSLKK